LNRIVTGIDGLDQILNDSSSVLFSLADNIICLQHRVENLINKCAIAVLKMRGSDHAKEWREFVIGGTGPAVPVAGD